jgi:hypothetical protein
VAQEVDQPLPGRQCRSLVLHQVRLTKAGTLELSDPQGLADSPKGCSAL